CMSCWVEPRSTCRVCGSPKALDQRVPGSPSTAAVAGKAADSAEDAVTGRPWESRTGAARATGAVNRAARVRARTARTRVLSMLRCMGHLHGEPAPGRPCPGADRLTWSPARVWVPAGGTL